MKKKDTIFNNLIKADFNNSIKLPVLKIGIQIAICNSLINFFCHLYGNSSITIICFLNIIQA